MARSQAISEPSAWIGSKIQNDASWVYHFDVDALAEIDAALAHAKHISARVPFAPESFPLPHVARVMEKILDDVENGQGFKLLRGIPRSRSFFISPTQSPMRTMS